ncbi:MAG: nitroreductase family protein [Treponema sp.]|jgi:nitroreductase|nr:nitroreductase family protein [Treponema sp.]
MNEVINCILHRRSIRSFTESPLSDVQLEIILKAATHAPSGKNIQTWRFTAINNREKIETLQKISEQVLLSKNEKLHGFYHPRIIILASNDRKNPNGLADCSCALQNIFLAAASLGIGSCWINGLKNICDEPEIRTFLSELDVPESHIVYGAASLGFPQQEPAPRLIKTNAIKIIE